MGCSGRAMLSQPCSLSLGHRVVAKGIFACKPGSLQNLQTRPKLSSPLALLPALRHFTRQRDSKSQSVLSIVYPTDDGFGVIRITTTGEHKSSMPCTVSFKVPMTVHGRAK